jgi:hypothetical protein
MPGSPECGAGVATTRPVTLATKYSYVRFWKNEKDRRKKIKGENKQRDVGLEVFTVVTMKTTIL